MYGRNRCEEDDEKDSGSNGDPKSWLSTESNDSLSPHHPPASGPGLGSSSDLDRVLYNDLVQIVPLVQSLIDKKSSSSFTRRGSLIYTKTPSRKNDAKNKLKSKHLDKEEGKNSKNVKDGSPDDCSAFSANVAAEKDREELSSLKQQLEDLRSKIVEKDELLKAAEVSKNQMVSVQSQVDQLKRCAAEKDSLIKTSQQQLNDAKIKLADKQAALEKLQWEARTSHQKVERLQEELDSMQSQISSLMLLFEGLSKDEPIKPTEDYDISPHYADHLAGMDEMDDIEMQKMEEARKAYIEAVAVAKEKQDEESLAAAAKARLHLQSFVFRSNDE
uniref:Uncharacterized protein n=1 Tax=Opuntia streptacantha TaxID=393608 RepID=A0A7C9D5U1_OPUST